MSLSFYNKKGETSLKYFSNSDLVKNKLNFPNLTQIFESLPSLYI